MQRLIGKVVIAVLVMAAITAGAQSAPPATASNSTQATANGSQSAAPTTESKLTKAQAQELLRSVDEIIQFVSSDSKLPIQHPVKRAIISRDAANKYFAGKMNEDKSIQQVERSEIVLKKFGMLDHDFHLGSFLLSLLTEQVAGFYDPKSKTINLLDWVVPELQQPVLAHELTHALQDQHVDLKKWSEVTQYSVAKTAAEDNLHIQTDEADTAREAVIEGQAMVVFADYGLQSTHKTLATEPEVVEKMQDAMADTGDSPMMARAPLMLQQTLMFPYREGLGFEARILASRGVSDAFAGTLDRPPSSSWEILNPASYLGRLPVPVLRMPNIHPLIDKDYVPYDVGVMGALDVRMLTELFAGQEQASALAPAWDGGLYFAAQRRSAKTAEEKASTASLGLLYYSHWKNETSARNFARIYEDQLPRKYKSLVLREKDAKSADEQVYSTPEGDVLVQIVDNGVFVAEGFDVALARQLSDAVITMQAGGPLQQAGLSGDDSWSDEHPSRVSEARPGAPASEAVPVGGELGLGFAQALAGFGVPKVALGSLPR
ncbi:MAG TPA: hypothetical protein VGB94_07410 [Acidobacteriaceae bacterium]